METKPKQLSSSSFPKGHRPTTHSHIHKTLEQPYQIVAVNIRPFQNQDIQQIILLHRQWFPVEYGNGFYNKITNSIVKCFVAEAQIAQNLVSQKCIVGVLVFRCQNAQKILRVQKWQQYFFWNYVSLYIMTLGVIDQFRNQGIGKMFLQFLMEATKKETNIKYIDLHMVAYNTASKFYQKNGFQAVETLKQHYENIKGQPQDAVYYVKFVNGGEKRQNWKQFVKSLYNWIVS